MTNHVHVVNVDTLKMKTRNVLYNGWTKHPTPWVENGGGGVGVGVGVR